MKKPVPFGLYWFAFTLAGIVALAIDPSTSYAAGCTAMDQQIRTQYHEAAQAALLTGDLERYGQLQQSVAQKVSAGCRTALRQLEPMRVRCTAEEKTTVLEHYRAVMQAAYSMDLMRIFAVMEELEQAVSPQCWHATNRHTDPQVQNACTAAELDHLASFAGPILRATAHALTTEDVGPLIELGQRAMAPLSQTCGYALARLQQAKQSTSQPSRQYEPTNVLDHGGGTYSVPGLGACTPSGCMAY